jgi:alanyl aminopeptidase
MKKIILSLFIFSLFSCQGTDPSSNTVDNQAAKTNISTKQEETISHTSSIPKGQLPKDMVPTHIYLDLQIIPDEVYFSGKTRIKATVNKSQKIYYIHGKLLQVSAVQLKDNAGNIHRGHYQQIDESGIAELSFEQPIALGEVELSIDYKSKFNEALEGLYRVKDGGINYAFTQFESISARLAFPGFDEPAFKVPYDISLTVKNEHVAISNTPIKNTTQLDNGLKRIEFLTSKPLPSYLLAFVVGEFDVVKWQDLPVTAVRDRPVALAGLATKGKGDKLNYALEHTAEILESLENYFQIPYPYLKLDIIAVPDFSAGAMENAGAITYREQLLLFDDNPSQQQKRSYMGVHAHELAHQWFGNLVTPYWWNDIWLNEAFATWMSYTALKNVYPEQNFDQRILSGSLSAMKSDSLISARQIRQPIKSNHDISSAFDGITYSKGGGVLEMINTFLTPEQFRNGIHDYMLKFAFKNASADDFINAISASSKNIPADLIRSSINSFLEQPGIPYLDINNRCEDGVNTVSLNQSRYLPLGSHGSETQKWKIPACLSYEIDGKRHQDCEMIDQQQQEFTLSGSGCAQYIMPNANGSGYFRYTLSPDNWSKLYKNLDNLTAKEVISLNDSFNASLDNGKIDLITFMTVAPVIATSKLNNIAKAPMSTLTYLHDKVTDNKEQKQQLADIANKLYLQKFNELDFLAKENDSVEDKKLRTSVIQFLADIGNNSEIRAQLVAMAIKYTGFHTDSQLHPLAVERDLISTALMTAVEDLPAEFTAHLLSLFDASTEGTTRGRLLNGMAASKDTQFTAQMRDWILSDRLRGNEIYTIFFTQVNDKDLQFEMWQWVQDNLQAFKQRMPTWFQGRLPLVGSGFCSNKHKGELQDFFEPIIEDLSGGPRTLAQVTERIELCIAKKKHYKPMLDSYLTTQI